MAANTHEPDNPSRWKSRYYEVLGEIEEREQSWREAEGLLRQLINHLIVAADVRHRPLTESLNELRNGLREGRELLRLREIADRISAQVEELDKLRDQEQPRPAELLLKLFDKIQFQDSATRQLRQLKRQLDELKPGEDPTPLCNIFATMLNDMLMANDDLIPAKSRKQRLLDRILMRQEKLRQSLAEAAHGEKLAQAQAEESAHESSPTTTRRLMAPAVGDLLLQLALRLPETVRRRINFQALKKHTNKARQRKDLIAIIDVIAQNIDAAYAIEEQPVVILDDESLSALAKAVHQLLGQMDPPPDLKAKINELEKFAKAGNGDAEGLIHCLNSLSQVVADICRRLSQQRDDLESFILKLGMQLEELDIGLQKSGSMYNELHQQNMRMDKAVQDELRAIQDSMRDNADRDVLGEDVGKHLESIDFQLQHFRDLEKDHYERVQQLFAELSNKVTTLVSESSLLREQLEDGQKQSMYDALTGLPNRGAYEERLALEVARSKRYGMSLSLAVFGVDKFETINDNYGHAAGDRVLKLVADILSTRTRETDFTSYYDAAEFVVLMPETLLESAQQVAEKICKVFEQTVFQFHGVQVSVTMSAGIAQYNHEELVSVLLDQADAALYEARQFGGNRVACAGPETGTPGSTGEA